MDRNGDYCKKELENKKRSQLKLETHLVRKAKLKEINTKIHNAEK